ncbi:hypothetical protein [Oleiagrimonas sp.]|jgi:hypothetical protein|uniref:hypothetical protein n=1 Tax=Oleiagrimonas sp. TaxID=2010330 RepID=UPI002617FA09|nr:hypothetical protein [Oleiagrimonas sp.]MDA3914411.1 hypothetical protein [Oleiagrimonas sp.]
MKKLLVAGFMLALCLPGLAFAQSAFNGTWKLDPGTVHSTGGEAMIISLKDGMYHCNCHPPVTVKADGEDHPVKGDKHVDTVAIKVVDDHTVQETYKKDNKVISTSTITVAADGKTATNDFTYSNGADHATGKAVMKRVAKGAPGSNALAGSWRLDHVESATGTTYDPSFKVDGNSVTSSDAAGDSYTATIGGKPVPSMVNGKADGTVSVKRLGKDTLRETYAEDGKVTRTSTMTIAADGKTMKMVVHNIKNGRTTTMTHEKQ